MKAIEAAEHSDVIECNSVVFLRLHNSDIWIDPNEVRHRICNLRGSSIPLVPKKIYKVGDKVTFIEALNSGMCFKTGKATVKIQSNRCYFWATDHWIHVGWGLNEVLDETCTLCDDPSIPPRPTLESLPAWTRCKVVLGCAIYDVVKMPGGVLQYFDKYGVFSNITDNRVKLLSVYNPKIEQWEDV